MPGSILDPGYTPGKRDFSGLLELVDDPDQGTNAVRALARAGLAAALVAIQKITPGRIAVAGRVAKDHPDERLIATLAAALAHDDARVRKAAIVAMGKVRTPAVSEALAARYEAASEIDRRAIVVSLGKVGDARALELVRTRPEATRARLQLERTLTREKAENQLDSPLPSVQTIVWRCRRGLEPLLSDDVRKFFGDVVVGVGEVSCAAQTTLRAALASRVPIDGDVADTLAKSADVMRAWTNGAVRFRVELGAKKRGEKWKIAERVAEKTNAIVSDPTSASWEVIVEEARNRLLLRPKSFTDFRFSYRERDVPAASHPTIAAALARVGGCAEDDVVWDPFVGSGLELCERSRIGPYRRLIGTDISDKAIAAARANLSAARARAELHVADVREHSVRGATLVITNPPMGRRLVRDRTLGDLYDAALASAHKSLVRGGRLVWLTALASRKNRHFSLVRGTSDEVLSATLKRAGAELVVERSLTVDMGGFDAELQLLRKP